MKKINFERKQNCFVKTEGIESKLLWGNLDSVSKPWITVLIPTYKRTELLKQAIMSVLKQFHTKFFWDIIILDNEPYDGIANENEKLVKKLANNRILYYRNTEHLEPGDNFNRGIQLARGEWITMLHDDDILVYSALQYLGKAICYCESLGGKKLGAICALQEQFQYNLQKEEANIDVEGWNNGISFAPMNMNLYRLKPMHAVLTTYIGCSIPTCGTTLRKQAVLDNGGFDEELGICADQFLFYNLEKKWRVYNSGQILGFWRWGNNQSSQNKNHVLVATNQYDFRKYVFHKNPFNFLMGLLFANSHNKHFVIGYISQIEKGVCGKLSESDFKYVCPHQPSAFMFFCACVVEYLYKIRQQKKAIKFGKKAWKYLVKEQEKGLI